MKNKSYNSEVRPTLMITAIVISILGVVGMWKMIVFNIDEYIQQYAVGLMVVVKVMFLFAGLLFIFSASKPGSTFIKNRQIIVGLLLIVLILFALFEMGHPNSVGTQLLNNFLNILLIFR